MPDRVEREIEEILSRLDDLPAEDPDKSPIPIGTRKRTAAPKAPADPGLRSRLASQIDPPTIMISGAVLMIGGLVLTMFAEAFIWLSLAGILLFLAAFLLSFIRAPRPSAPQQPGGVYWRDRYISYAPEQQSGWSRFKSRFRR